MSKDGEDNLEALCSNTKRKALRRREAMKVMEKRSESFKLHDKNKDGFLDHAEIMSYSWKEFGFSMTEALVRKLLKAMQMDGKGVPEAEFQRLKASRSLSLAFKVEVRIGCLREMVKDEERRKQREERDKELEVRKAYGLKCFKAF